MQKIILGLIGLNLVLAAGLAITVAQHASRKTDAIPAVGSPSTTQIAETGQPKPGIPVNTSESARDAIWKALVSTNLKKYAANLRRVGCPEDTIQEIMLAEVNRLYAAREKALKARPEDLSPWEAGAQGNRRDAESKLRQLLAEKRNLLKELTGVDPGISMPSRLAGRDTELFEAAFQALPESTRNQVRAIQENYWAQSDDLKQRTMGYLEPEDRDEFVRIKAERRDALAKVFTPQELQDYEMQTSATASALRSRMDGFNVSDAEFRKIFDYMQPLDEQYSLSRRNPDPVSQEFTAARTQAEQDLQNYIHQTLGDDRYAEYQRTRDPVYRSLQQAGSEAGVPQDSILQAYQATQQMQDEAKRLMQDPNLTQEQRSQSLQDLQIQALQRLQPFFGDKADQVLQRLQGNPMANQPGFRANINQKPAGPSN
jgi:hypothetical protein